LIDREVAVAEHIEMALVEPLKIADEEEVRCDPSPDELHYLPLIKNSGSTDSIFTDEENPKAVTS